MQLDTIAKALNEGLYSSLEALEMDVEAASDELLSTSKTSEAASKSTIRHYPPSSDDIRLMTEVLAFKKVLKNTIMREVQRAHQKELSNIKLTDANLDENGPPAHTNDVEVKGEAQEGRAVLTLFANAQGPKQLFSSLQNPTLVPPSKKLDGETQLDTSVKVEVPLQEAFLPSILSTTKIVPVQSADPANHKGKRPTIGELFAPPATLLQLAAPKPAKPLSTKGNTISWVPPESVAKTSRKSHTYFNQNQSTGQWLGYGGVDTPKEPTSPEAKQKHRQRALSTGEANPPPSQTTMAALQLAREDALFRGAFSSFAPTHDDSVAIIPGEVKNRVWWHKVGEKRFQDTMVIDPALLEGQTDGMEVNSKEKNGEDELFRQVVESFDVDLDEDPQAEPVDKNLVDEILAEISELLETLHSYQRIRYSQLPNSSRTPASQTAALTALAGSPSNPSSAEVETYKILKSQLALMISALPPYAVAKLNGDQMADLKISRNLVIGTREYRGVMEEDQVSRLAKAAALTAPVGAAPGSRITSQYANAGGQYSRTPSLPTPRTTHQNPNSYYPQQQPPHRSPSLHYHRPSQGSAYQTPSGYSASSQRPGYTQGPGFAQQTPRHSSHNSSGYQSSYTQRPSSSGYNISTGTYQATPQSQTPGRNYQANHNTFPRSQNTASTYNNGGYSVVPPQSPHNRNSSPNKPGSISNHTPTPQYNRSRPGSFGAPTPHMRASHQQPAPATPRQEQFNPNLAVASALGPTGYHTSLTEAEQMNLVERQLLLLEQHKSQMAAKSAAGLSRKKEMSTPQPAQKSQETNGTISAPQANGTSAPVAPPVPAMAAQTN